MQVKLVYHSYVEISKYAGDDWVKTVEGMNAYKKPLVNDKISYDLTQEIDSDSFTFDPNKFLELLLKQLAVTLLIWFYLSLLYQIPILSLAIQITAVTLVWDLVHGWETLAYFGHILRTINDEISLIASIAVLISFLYSFTYSAIDVYAKLFRNYGESVKNLN